MIDPTEPVLGWRKWKCDAGDGLLSSLFKSRVWIPGERMEAKCERDFGRVVITGRTCSVAPTARCTCGIYAVKTQAQLDRVGMVAASAFLPQNLDRLKLNVIGRASLWGRIIEHEFGFKAQYAYPYELWLVPPLHAEVKHAEAVEFTNAVARRVRENYLVDVGVLDG